MPDAYLQPNCETPMSGNRSSTLAEKGLLAVLTICAVIVTGLLIRKEFPPPAASAALKPTVEKNWREAAAKGQRLVSGDSAVTLVVFSDFECPFCRRLAGRIDSVVSTGEQIDVVYRHYPLSFHKNSRRAALAAECAGLQGRFRSMHDVFYAQTESLGTRSWTALASDARVPDTLAFTKCLADGATTARVQEDSLAATRYNISGTPLLFVNQQRWSQDAAYAADYGSHQENIRSS